MSESLLPQRFPFPLFGAVPLSPSALDAGRRGPGRAISLCRAGGAGRRAGNRRIPRGMERGGPRFLCQGERKEAADLVPRQPPGGQRRTASLDRHPRRAERPSRQPLLPPLHLLAQRRRQEARRSLRTIAAHQPRPRAGPAGARPAYCGRRAGSAATATSWNVSCRRRR